MTQLPNGPRWGHFYHEADIGICGVGRTLEEAFEQAGLALTAVICPLGMVRDAVETEITCEAVDEEMLFVEWLDAVIYEMATQRMLFRRYRVHIHGCELTATLWGEPIDIGRHQPAVEIKGATLTELSVHHGSDGLWRARCVVDV